MRIITICLTFAAGIFFCTVANAQISFKTEYIGNSHYMHRYWPDYWQDDQNKPNPAEKVGDSKGSSLVYSLNASIPFYMKMNENNRPTAWGVALGGTYASLKNQKFSSDVAIPSEIMNLNLGFFHMRPISDKWSMMASLGAGIYTPHAKFSDIGWEHVLANGAVVFIWHVRHNLDLGAGIAVNNSLGYPMVFPAMYVNWSLDRKFKVNISMMEGLELSAGYEFTDWFRLSLSGEMNGQMALVKKDGKRMMFTHQYIVAGLKPQVKLGKTGLSLYAMGGMSVHRPAEYSELTLKAMFVGTDHSYFFRPAPYASVGIQFGF
jgi:hypothetical protein